MQTITDLNARYGAPGRIVFHLGHAGYPEVVLANRYGTAEVALMGANVLSYRPTGHAPVIFRGAKRDYNRADSVHGGIPLCWPQFGNRFSKTLPQHGFARMMLFEVRGTQYSEELSEITIGLTSDAETRKLWPHDFDLTYVISVSMKLNLTLTTHNTGKEPFDFNCGFHPYLAVRERDDVVLNGLDGLPGVFAKENKPIVGVPSMKIDFAPNHVYALPDRPWHACAVLDNGLHRAIALAASGCGKMVVWNPGETDGAAMKDLAPDDGRRFVCVEPVSEWPGGKTLAAGEKHVLTAAIQSTLEERGAP